MENVKNNEDNIDFDLEDRDFQREVEIIMSETIEEDSILSDNVNLYFKSINLYPLVSSKEEELEYFKRIKNGDKEAKEEFINRNLRLVAKVAKYYSKYYGDSILDLIQEGNIGLLTAVEKFEPGLGYKFSTYAMWWIKQGMIRYLDSKSNIIRLPVHAKSKLRKYRFWESQFLKEQGRLPDSTEMLEGLKISEMSYDFYIKYVATLGVSSINMLISDEDDTEVGDMIPDDNSIDNIINQKLLSEDLLDCLKSVLSKKEYDIICLRFGLISGDCRTLQDVGELYNVSRERIRQIEKVAFRKLKSSRKSKYILADCARELGIKAR